MMGDECSQKGIIYLRFQQVNRRTYWKETNKKRCRREDNSRENLEGIAISKSNLINSVHSRDYWGTLVNELSS